MIDTPISEVFTGGSHWSMTVRRGVELTLEDIEGGANVGMLMYNPAQPLERLNLPDTLKCQHTFRLTRGHCLYSDMGRIFCSITHDDLGWHDAVGGVSDALLVRERWGARDYQTHRNEFYRNGRDGFLIELTKHGLGVRDLAANANWFSRIDAGADGSLNFREGHSTAGSRLTLRFEMDTLAIFHTCPHPLNPSAEYPRRPVRMTWNTAAPVAGDDYCRTFRPENGRGFANTELFNLG